MSTDGIVPSLGEKCKGSQRRGEGDHRLRMAQRDGAVQVRRQRRHTAAEIGGQALGTGGAAEEDLQRLREQSLRLLPRGAGQQGGQAGEVAPEGGHRLPRQHTAKGRRQHGGVQVQEQLGIALVKPQQQGVDGLRREIAEKAVFVGQAAEVVLDKFNAVLLGRAEEGGIVGGDVKLLGKEGGAVQAEKAVDAVRQGGAVEFVIGGEQVFLQLAVGGAGGLELAGDAALSRLVQFRQGLAGQQRRRVLRRGGEYRSDNRS